MHRSQSAAEGAEAPSNVVRLPTAAPRKVKQTFGRGDSFRQNRDSLTQFPRPNLCPQMRKALERARLIRDMQRTPELCIATAIFHTLDDMQKLRVQAAVAMMALKDGSTALQASAWLEAFTDGSAARDTKYALQRLDSGEWK